MKPGIYLAHKPVGATSFSLVQALMGEVEAAGLTRKQLPVCHGGTLDPFAIPNCTSSPRRRGRSSSTACR